MAEKEVRKTTTKRAVRRVASKTVPAATTVRKTSAASVRKAPSRVVPASSTLSAKRRSPKALFAGIFLFLVLLGVSAAIGLSDKGQLDVESVITLRKQGATTQEEKDALVNVPTEQAVNAAPNGGLVALDASEVPPPVEVSSTTQSTASSTSDTASSTESVDSGVEPEAETTPPEPVAEGGQ